MGAPRRTFAGKRIPKIGTPGVRIPAAAAQKRNEKMDEPANKLGLFMIVFILTCCCERTAACACAALILCLLAKHLKRCLIIHFPTEPTGCRDCAVSIGGLWAAV
uniref:LITAF domain-containing protein n=1 Tax=Ascaris lumbricoides TaxID=6252 RepID=A0A0M3HFE2_ASCLU